MLKVLNVLNIIMYWHTLSHVQDFSMLHNVLPIYTFNTYKLVDIYIYIYITLGSHKLLQTCGPPPSFSLLVIMYSKCKKLLINFPSSQMMLLLQNYFMSQHVNLTKLAHTQMLVHTHVIHSRHGILKMTWLYMMNIKFSYLCIYL
jgi:hypothetical protein